ARITSARSTARPFIDAASSSALGGTAGAPKGQADSGVARDTMCPDERLPNHHLGEHDGTNDHVGEHAVVQRPDLDARPERRVQSNGAVHHETATPHEGHAPELGRYTRCQL